MHALILWRTGLGLLVGKFCQFLTELFARDRIMVGYYCFTFLLLFLINIKLECAVDYAPSQIPVLFVDVAYSMMDGRT